MQQVYVDLFEQKTGVERSEKAVFGIRVIVKKGGRIRAFGRLS